MSTQQQLARDIVETVISALERDDRLIGEFTQTNKLGLAEDVVRAIEEHYEEL